MNKLPARFYRLIVVFVLAILFVSFTSGTVATKTYANAPPSAIRFDLYSNGSARITLTLIYNLTSDAERTAFRSIQNDVQTQQNVKQRFFDRMTSVATIAERTTGRSMAITNPTISLSTKGNFGIIQLSVIWKGLAATKDSKLVVTEPFRSGFQSERRVIISVPENYEITLITPNPDGRGNNTLKWTAGTNFSGFKLVATELNDRNGEATTAVPGFGVIVTVIALAIIVLLQRWH
ncbi:MAG: PGF-CTERM sorting domain-containing protein [Halobacteriaceae archaeon]